MYVFHPIIYTLLLLVVSQFASCKRSNSSDTKVQLEDNVDNQLPIEESKPKEVIMFFGNSLTAGYGLSKDESFPSIIENKIDSLSLDYQVINAGLSGETTSGGLNRIDWVLRQSIDVFVLELGANDMLRGLPVEETKKNLVGIIQKVKNKYPDCTIFICEMLASPNMGSIYADAFQKLYLEISTKENVQLIPFFLIDIIDRSELFLPDGKHPNGRGQKIVANHIWEYIYPVIK